MTISIQSDFHLAFISFIFILLLLILLLWKVRGWYRRQHFLARQETFTPSYIQKLRVHAEEKQIFQSVNLSHLAQQLRKHVEVINNQLDIEATVEKTIQAAGWFMPVTGTTKMRPEYLILVDRTTFKDHQSQLMDVLINPLIMQEVVVSRYYFDDDPRRCYPEVNDSAPLTLTQLYERHFDCRLMIFSDGNGFIDSITGDIVDWIDQVLAWSQPILFTLESPQQWGHRERLLEETHFVILPANETGLIAFVELMNTETAQPDFSASSSILVVFPEYFRERPRQWLERYPPQIPTVTELLKQVRDFLGEEGYYWFSACAVYPELHWQLTLHLGSHLSSSDGKPLLTKTRLTQLARLPWFRYGYMPNWLRNRLIDELPFPQENQIRTILQTLLQTAVNNNTHHFDLEIANPFQPRLLTLMQQWWTALTRSVPKHNPLQEKIFLTFMTNKLAVMVPKTLNHLLLKSRHDDLKPLGKQVSLSKSELPNFLTLIWLLFMQPVTLHHRLKACGITEPNASLLKLWQNTGETRQVKQHYVLKMLLALLGIIFLLALFQLILSNTLGNPMALSTWLSLTLIMIMMGIMTSWVVSVAFGMVFGITAGMLVSIVVVGMLGGGVIFDIVHDFFYTLVEIYGPFISIIIGAIYGLIIGFYFVSFSTSALFYGVYFGVVLGIGFNYLIIESLYKIAFSMTIGVAVGVIIQISGNIIFGTATGTMIKKIGGILPISIGIGLVSVFYGSDIITATLIGIVVYEMNRTLIIFKLMHSFCYPFEVAWQVLCYLIQKKLNYSTLQLVPILYHDFSYLPHPFLAQHIILEAQKNPVMAKRVLKAGMIAPGQHYAWQTALGHLQAHELTTQIQQHQFTNIAELQSRWLSVAKEIETDSLSTLFALRNIAHHLHLVSTTAKMNERQSHLEHAHQLLTALEHHLVTVCSRFVRRSPDCSPFDHIMITLLPTWKTVVAELHQELSETSLVQTG